MSETKSHSTSNSEQLFAQALSFNVCNLENTHQSFFSTLFACGSSINTKVESKENSEVVEKIMLQPMPKKAFIEIEELASSAAFLMADTAKNITAQNIILDGGWTAR